MGRAVAATFLVIGVVLGVLLFGDAGAIVGVVVAMIGFQGLTRGVEGVPYVAAALATTGGLIAIAWTHGLSPSELGLGPFTWITGLVWSAGIVVVVGAGIGIVGGIPRARHLFADERVTEVSGLTTARRALLDIPFGTVLVEEFAFRGVNLSKIESRPRSGLGRYRFVIDAEGSRTDAPVAEAVAALDRHCEEVRVLGSYPAHRR